MIGMKLSRKKGAEAKEVFVFFWGGGGAVCKKTWVLNWHKWKFLENRRS